MCTSMRRNPSIFCLCFCFFDQILMSIRLLSSNSVKKGSIVDPLCQLVCVFLFCFVLFCCCFCCLLVSGDSVGPFMPSGSTVASAHSSPSSSSSTLLAPLEIGCFSCRCPICDIVAATLDAWYSFFVFFSLFFLFLSLFF